MSTPVSYPYFLLFVFFFSLFSFSCLSLGRAPGGAVSPRVLTPAREGRRVCQIRAQARMTA